MKRRMIELKGDERQKLRRWYGEAWKALEGHPERFCIPRFGLIKIYCVIGMRSKLGDMHRFPSPRIRFSSSFMECEGKYEKLLKFLFKHELAHFLAHGHGRKFREVMLSLGYQQIHTGEYRNWLVNYGGGLDGDQPPIDELMEAVRNEAQGGE